MLRRLLPYLFIPLAFGCASADLKKADDTLKTVEKAVEVADKVVTATDQTPLKRHVVTKGDTLWGIDQHHGGDGFGWYGIYRQNRLEIANYDLIEPGQDLKWRPRAITAADRRRAYIEPDKK